MLKFFALLLIVVAALIVVIAALISWMNVKFDSIKNIEKIDPQNARVFSDEFLDDFIHDRREEIYAKLSKDAQSRLNRQQVDGLIDQLCDQFGKVIKFEFVSDISKVSVLSKIPSRDMVYQVTTDKEKACSFTIIVVPHESKLTVNEFYFSLASLTV